MSNKTTITDVPRSGTSDKDKFGLSAYEKGLEQFLRGAETPNDKSREVIFIMNFD